MQCLQKAKITIIQFQNIMFDEDTIRLSFFRP